MICSHLVRISFLILAGSLEFMAPELLTFTFYYDAVKSDIYSTGVIFYLLLYGVNPFMSPDSTPKCQLKNMIELVRQCKLKPLTFPYQPVISASIQNLIQLTLDPDPETRPTLEEIQFNLISID